MLKKENLHRSKTTMVVGESTILGAPQPGALDQCYLGDKLYDELVARILTINNNYLYITILHLSIQFVAMTCITCYIK